MPNVFFFVSVGFLSIEYSALKQSSVMISSQFAKLGGNFTAVPSAFTFDPSLICVDGRSNERFRITLSVCTWSGVGTRCRKCTVGLIKSMCSRMSSGTEYEWQPG